MKPYIVKNTRFLTVMLVINSVTFTLSFFMIPLVSYTTLPLSRGKLYLGFIILPISIIYDVVVLCKRHKYGRCAIKIDEDGILIDIDDAPRLERSWEWIKSMDVIHIKEKYKKGFFLHVTCWDGKSMDYDLSFWIFNYGRFKKAVLHYSGKDFFKTKYSVWRLLI